MRDKDKVTQALMAPPQTMGAGMSAMADAIAARKKKMGQFAAAPGGTSLGANMFNGVKSLFGSTGSGGLY